MENMYYGSAILPLHSHLQLLIRHTTSAFKGFYSATFEDIGRHNAYLQILHRFT